MHSKIFQITENLLSSEEYVTAETFYDNLPPMADYVSDLTEREAETCMMCLLDSALDGIFIRDGRELTFLGINQFVEEWITQIKESAQTMNIETFRDLSTLYRHISLCNKTHRDVESLIYYGADQEASPDPFGSFIMWLLSADIKPGAKFYIGGVVDFHC